MLAEHRKRADRDQTQKGVGGAQRQAHRADADPLRRAEEEEREYDDLEKRHEKLHGAEASRSDRRLHRCIAQLVQERFPPLPDNCAQQDLSLTQPQMNRPHEDPFKESEHERIDEIHVEEHHRA